MSGIVWLASYPKSGNTWVRAFLINLIADRAEPVPFTEYPRFITSEASGHWYAKRLEGELSEERLLDVARVRAQVHKDIAASSKNPLLVKTHTALGQIRGYHQINTGVTLGAVYIVRNPLDVAISLAHHVGGTVDEAIETLGQVKTRSSMRRDRVFEWTSDWSSHVRSWTVEESPHLHVVRYEDMIDDPQATFTALARFLKIDAEDERIDRAVSFADFHRLQAMEAESGFVEKAANADAFFRVGRKDQWRDVMSTEQQRRITARHREQMERFGYA